MDVFLFATASFVPEMSAAFCYGAYALWSMLLPRLQRAVRPVLRRRVDRVCGAAVLFLLFAEVGLRTVATLWPMPLLVTNASDQPANIAAHRLRPSSARFGFPVNRSGHFDSDFLPRSENPGRRIVASIGDSFSVGVVPHAFHFTTVCERELIDVDVYNIGVPNIGLHGYTYLLQHEALPLDPHLVIVNLFVGNDLTDGMIDERRPGWYDPDNYLVSVLWRRLRALAQAPRFAWPERDELAAARPSLEDPLLETPTFGKELFLEIEVRRAQKTCGADPYANELFFAAFRNLERIAAGRRLGFVLIPDEFQVETCGRRSWIGPGNRWIAADRSATCCAS